MNRLLIKSASYIETNKLEQTVHVHITPIYLNNGKSK